jgi:hypothetical protein
VLLGFLGRSDCFGERFQRLVGVAPAVARLPDDSELAERYATAEELRECRWELVVALELIARYQEELNRLLSESR